MDQLADSRVDLEDVSNALATDLTICPEFDDEELEKELDSLLYKNDTEKIEDLFDTLKVDTTPADLTDQQPEISASIDDQPNSHQKGI